MPWLWPHLLVLVFLLAVRPPYQLGVRRLALRVPSKRAPRRIGAASRNVCATTSYNAVQHRATRCSTRHGLVIAQSTPAQHTSSMAQRLCLRRAAVSLMGTLYTMAQYPTRHVACWRRVVHIET